MSAILEPLSSVCLLLGSFLLLTGALGFLRFADFYARLHACGVTETLATALIILGLMLQATDSALPQFKLLLILLFVLFSSPTASHALAKAAWNAGVRPRDRRGRRDIALPPGDR
ncbi:monovalent cation/H(+) antiporter subunit G [Parahaliea aestuarii]|uniref:Sodium:proton antiporter n=1 Tax=Parahaliea aestuarii TaxID=1852021 RepID=A0A5C8ZVA7_9GAMM|nr:monovalent cation/H(+) antiporter subunit G [Parahaliea aestuarii]TXS92386.1 sodium:proton antiporter [Parahaliea aestuarii]